MGERHARTPVSLEKPGFFDAILDNDGTRSVPATLKEQG